MWLHGRLEENPLDSYSEVWAPSESVTLTDAGTLKAKDNMTAYTRKTEGYAAL